MARYRGLVVALVALCAACRHPIVPPEKAVAGLPARAKIYTLTNLHADDRDKVVSAANFQYLGRDPSLLGGHAAGRGPEVAHVQGRRDRQRLHVRESPARPGEPLDQNLARYFGPTCPQAELDALTPLEKEGVRQGVAKKGMRKQAVILAIGYPPLRDTRTLELPDLALLEPPA